MSNRKDFLMKPKVDYCFKELMEDEEVRSGFISAILGVEPDKIADTELLPTHLRKQHADDKLGILDVRVRLKDGTQMDMEMQVVPFELWAHFFAAEKKEEFEVLAKENTYIKKAYNRLTELSANEEKRLEYEAREKAIRDYNWQMECKWRAGHDAGIQQGIQQGVQQGRLQTLKELLDAGLISMAEVASLLQTSEQKAEEMINNIQ